MTEENKSQIFNAIELVKDRVSDRLEREGWKVYRVGNIIRIDIDHNKLKQSEG